MKTIVKDGLTVQVCNSRDLMGQAAGTHIAGIISQLLQSKDEVNIIFAAAPSQNEMLAALMASDVDFSRINAFHMDEYLGLAPDAPQRFAQYLNQHVFDKAKFKSVHYLGEGSPDATEECERYAALLRQYPIDITLGGIGENGHIAFNDPHEADFNDPVWVKRVTLDDACRMQQVNDGCFATFDQVPQYAVTLTIPALMAAKYFVAAVPGPNKRAALTRAVTGEITTACPASILRTHPNCVIFCEPQSAADII